MCCTRKGQKSPFHAENVMHVLYVCNNFEMVRAQALDMVWMRDSCRGLPTVFYKFKLEKQGNETLGLGPCPMGKNCPLKKRNPTNGSHKWETISESTESVERNINGLRQMDIRIRLRYKSFHLWDLLWDPFEGEN